MVIDIEIQRRVGDAVMHVVAFGQAAVLPGAGRIPQDGLDWLCYLSDSSKSYREVSISCIKMMN